MKILDLITISLITGIIGSLTGVISLVWHVKNNRPKVVPKYHTGFIDLSGTGKDMQHIFSINFSNPTKHRIVVSSAGISFKNKNYLHFIGNNDGFPKVLLQGDSHVVYRNIDFIKKAIDENGSPNYVWVRDATGKLYKGSVRKMIKNVEAMYKVKHNKK